MSHHWVIDVLNDLRTYAQQNDMPKLADYLSDALNAASEDLALPALLVASRGTISDLADHR